MPAKTDKQPLDKQCFIKYKTCNYLIINVKCGVGKCRKIKNRRGFRAGRRIVGQQSGFEEWHV